MYLNGFISWYRSLDDDDRLKFNDIFEMLYKFHHNPIAIARYPDPHKRLKKIKIFLSDWALPDSKKKGRDVS